MATHMFENDEAGYKKWLRDNPNGYVLTTSREISVNYLPLHRASCRTISRYTAIMAGDAFTGHRYIKICSRSTNDLLEWIKAQGGKGFTKLCSICTPDPDKDVTDSLEDYYSRLTTEVSQSLKDSEGRKSRLRNAPKIPESFSATTTVFKRNPDVIAEVLERANGVCQICNKKAPFTRASNGSPYLEVHHKTHLAQGGEDSVENAIALCPNCHRKSHFG